MTDCFATLAMTFQRSGIARSWSETESDKAICSHPLSSRHCESDEGGRGNLFAHPATRHCEQNEME
jgi:hypothetical protein